MAKKETTIEDLAGMVNRGFKSVSNDIEAFESNINERFERVDERFERVDERFERVDEKIERVEERLNSMDRRMARIETDVSEIRKMYVDPQEFEDLVARVKYLEIKAGIESGK